MTRDEFEQNMEAWSNHRSLLWEALQATTSSSFPVLELGAGHGSTPFLRQYCKDGNRHFISYESNREWADIMESIFVTDWNNETLWINKYSVVLLDLAPGNYRQVALMKLNAEIIVIHDSEPIGWNASDYRVRPLFKNFKFVKDNVPKEKGQPWTTALSDTIDVTKFIV